VSFLIISILYGSTAISGKLLYQGEYSGHFVAVTEGVHIHAWGQDNRNFTLYVLDFDNGYKALNESSLENVSYVCIYENVAYIEINVLVPSPGWYVILVTPSNPDDSVIRYDIIISRNVPHLGPFFLGLFLVLGCILFKGKKAISERNLSLGMPHVFGNQKKSKPEQPKLNLILTISYPGRKKCIGDIYV